MEGEWGISAWITVSVCCTLQGMRMSGEAQDVLHLTGVDRESAGTYACSALNTEGETRSSSLTLRVQCEYLGRETVVKRGIPNDMGLFYCPDWWCVCGKFPATKFSGFN